VSRTEAALLALATVVFAGALGLTAGVAAEEAPGGDPRAGAAGPLSPSDSWAIPNLPAGWTVDPLTGLLRGGIPAAPGSEALEWERLRAYEYRPGLANLPPELGALDGKAVTMVGFLMPLYQYDEITEFMLVGSHWSCCYGFPAGLNGTVLVRLAPGEPSLPNTAEPMLVTGAFRVREEKDEGYVLSIFAIEGAKVSVLGY
jgi:hypothetical protein